MPVNAAGSSEQGISEDAPYSPFMQPVQEKVADGGHSLLLVHGVWTIGLC
jgi:hypothetical protein